MKSRISLKAVKNERNEQKIKKKNDFKNHEILN